jgi:uncharacterized phage protein (predicted DNA packaging)
MTLEELKQYLRIEHDEDDTQLEELKQYLRIEHDEDDTQLIMFQRMATEYIKNAVGRFDEEKELYKFANAMLVGHWYETREIARIGNNSYNIPHAFESIILQLKYCYVEGEEE